MMIAGACGVLSGLAGVLMSGGANSRASTVPTADQLSVTALVCIIVAVTAFVRSRLDAD